MLKISFSESAIAVPPYLPLWELVDEAGEQMLRISLNLSNYLRLLEDSLYVRAYLNSLRIAATATVLTLLVGFPMAYAMARTSERWRPMLLMLVILPFWTSFLIRVYAWIGILKDEGLLNAFLIWTGLISAPLHIYNTETAVLIGIVYSYLPFMILPLYANLEKHDPALIEAAVDLGCPPWKAFWLVTVPLAAARHHRRLLPGLHPGRGRVRHPRPARRLGDADDRPHPLARLLPEPRLADRLRRWRPPAPGPGGPDPDLPAPPGRAPGAS